MLKCVFSLPRLGPRQTGIVRMIEGWRSWLWESRRDVHLLVHKSQRSVSVLVIVNTHTHSSLLRPY